jgi:hypothetical protein
MFHRIYTLAALVCAATIISGCADDRPVYAGGADFNNSDAGSGGDGAGGSTSNAGTGGNGTGGAAGSGGDSAGGSTSNAGTGGDGGTSTGGSNNGGTGGYGLPGYFHSEVRQVFSFEITESDPYSSFGFYGEKGQDLINCAYDGVCMKKAKDNTPGRPFQFLKDGSYSESFTGISKAFCTYQNSSGCDGGHITVTAGYGCKDKQGHSRTCLVSGVAQLSGSKSATYVEIGPSNTVALGYDDGDVCTPTVFCFIAEHGVSIEQ